MAVPASARQPRVLATPAGMDVVAACPLGSVRAARGAAGRARLADHATVRAPRSRRACGRVERAPPDSTRDPHRWCRGLLRLPGLVVPFSMTGASCARPRNTAPGVVAGSVLVADPTVQPAAAARAGAATVRGRSRVRSGLSECPSLRTAVDGLCADDAWPARPTVRGRGAQRDAPWRTEAVRHPTVLAGCQRARRGVEYADTPTRRCRRGRSVGTAAASSTRGLRRVAPAGSLRSAAPRVARPRYATSRQPAPPQPAGTDQRRRTSEEPAGLCPVRWRPVS